jgi:hypothetical protein
VLCCGLSQANGSATATQWECMACTLLNATSVDLCAVCTTSRPSAPGWACKDCTFLNPMEFLTCEMCSIDRFVNKAPQQHRESAMLEINEESFVDMGRNYA